MSKDTRRFHFDVDALIERLNELKKPVKDGIEASAGGLGVYVFIDGKQYRLTSANKDEIDNGESTGVVLGLTLDKK